jgi:hypothetical protein
MRLEAAQTVQEVKTSLPACRDLSLDRLTLRRRPGCFLILEVPREDLPNGGLLLVNPDFQAFR